MTNRRGEGNGFPLRPLHTQSTDYLYLKRVANPEDTRHEYFSIQELSLIMEENGWVRPEKSYMLFKEEVYNAYKEGKLPAWVEEYEKTGKLPE